MPADSIIEGRGLTKRFGGVTALDTVNFGVAAGQITALLGEEAWGARHCDVAAVLLP